MNDEAVELNSPRISAIETIVHPDYPHLCYVQIDTDEGIQGLGESYYNPETVSEYIHSAIAPAMLGQPATNIANMWSRIGLFCDGRQPFAGVLSIESSASSAFDIAMWDLRAKLLGLPLCEALGGSVREQIRVYNTCADARHLPPPGTPRSEWRGPYEHYGIGGPVREWDTYDDWTASIERPAELARNLVESGITAMKIYPFQRLARETGGLYITPAQLDENLEPFRQIRAAVGNAIDISADLVSVWTLAPGIQIARALDDFNLLWIEDVLRVPSGLHATERLAQLIRTPLAGYDHLAGLGAYLELIHSTAVAVVRIDLLWGGGVSEALRIAGYAEARGLGVVLHGCSGPVHWAAGVHCAVHLRNAMIQESMRAYIHHVFPTMVRAIPQVVGGHVRPLPALGHGAELLPSFLEGAHRRHSTVRAGDLLTEPVT